ncbi:MAG: Cysteine desulfurase [uncultured Thermomicrobiales bacterium]|uniref:Cysteine desulfurase n=1 Tax=uncultured Thermomicrobiales bacterium TaxID=1645740 RepID=A0A6J4VTA6_9BACT|nr:MAG: Cysteine desulfurase [uncultured Thermomicrobiales bacterium]
MVKDADTRKLERLRAQLPAVTATGYFNAGTNGPIARVVHDAIVRKAEQELNEGRIVPGVYQDHAVQADKVRALLARLLGGNSEEYALTQSTNDGLNIALNGLDWSSGDEVITTSLEHPCLYMPLALLSHRYGIRIRIAEIGDGAGDIAGVISRLISPNTRVIALSHVLWSSGVVVDLPAISALARENDLLLVVDGAQSVGQVAVDIPATGADAYTISGQKWLGGPEGTGAVFIRRDRFVDFAPSSVRYGQYDPTGFFLPAPGARRYEMGECNPAAVEGLKAAITFLLEDVGADWAFARSGQLGARLLKRLSGMDGVTVHSPKGRIGGLVCFNIPDLDPAAVADKLYDKGFTIRYVAAPPGPAVARASVGWWNTEEEVDTLASAISNLATAIHSDATRNGHQKETLPSANARKKSRKLPTKA